MIAAQNFKRSIGICFNIALISLAPISAKGSQAWSPSGGYKIAGFSGHRCGGTNQI
jgi:hypothetical protein